MLHFAKMHATGDDYIYIENFDNAIECPESLCIRLCNRHKGIGGFGIILMEKSNVADAKMRLFNRDGSEGRLGGNSIRCVGKYLYDNGLVKSRDITIETGGGVKRLTLYTNAGKVTYAGVDMGQPDLRASALPATICAERLINYPVEIGGGDVQCQLSFGWKPALRGFL